MPQVNSRKIMKKLIVTILIFLSMILLIIPIEPLKATDNGVNVNVNIKKTITLSITSMVKSYNITSNNWGKTYTWNNNITVNVKSNTDWEMKTELSQDLTKTTPSYETIPTNNNYRWKGGDQLNFIYWTRVAGSGTAQIVKTGTITTGLDIPISIQLYVPNNQAVGTYTTTIIFTANPTI